MANRETLEELLKLPLPSLSDQDPFFHTQQFPKFMKRRTILQKDYDIKKFDYLKRPQQRASKPKALSHLITQKLALKSIEDIKYINPGIYDEAIDKQRLFTSSSPSHHYYTKADHRYSTSLPIDSRPKPLKNRQNKEKNSNFNRKIAKLKDLSFSSVPKNNLKLLIARNSPKKCLDCSQTKCVCIEDSLLLSQVVSNLNKGKVLLEEIKAKRKTSRSERTNNQKKLAKKHKISFEEDLMRYSAVNQVLPSLEKPNYRRNST